MAARDRAVEVILGELAGWSHGVVTRREMLRAGVTRHQIESRIRRGALIPVHRGVFRVGHQAPSVPARYTAAVKACGDGSLLAGRAAAHLFGLLKRPLHCPKFIALDEDELARAVHEADARHHTTPDQVEQVLSRRHNWPGARKLRRVIWARCPSA